MCEGGGDRGVGELDGGVCVGGGVLAEVEDFLWEGNLLMDMSERIIEEIYINILGEGPLRRSRAS